MALQVKICVKGTGNCNVIDLFDITGTYGISNPVLPNSASPTGYGLPNLDISTIVSAVLDIQKYDFESDTVKPFVTGIDVSSVLPNITGTPFRINGATYGVTFVDGIYHFDLTLSDGTDDYTAEFYFLQDCAAWCCYEKLIADKCACSGGDTKAAELHTLLESLEASWCCTNFQAVSDILKKINKICSPCGCH